MQLYTYLARLLEADSIKNIYNPTLLLYELREHNPFWQELQNYWSTRYYKISRVDVCRTNYEPKFRYCLSIYLLPVMEDVTYKDEEGYHAIVKANLIDMFDLDFHVRNVYNKTSDEDFLNQTEVAMRKMLRKILLAHVSTQVMLDIKQLERNNLTLKNMVKSNQDRSRQLCQISSID